MRIRLLVERNAETERFLVYCPELPGCSAVSPSREKAIEEVRGRILDYFRPERWIPPGADDTHIEL